MKSTRVLCMLFLGVVVHASLFAQVTFLVISKSHGYIQTDNSTNTQEVVNPWGFEAHVEGTYMGTAISGAAASLTIPSGSGSTAIAYDGANDKWKLKNSYVDQASLDAAYGNGNYTMTANGQTINPISVTGDLYASAPLATNLSGGTIVGGILTWNVAQDLTITINGTTDHMGINVDGNSYNDSTEGFGVGTLSFTIPATSMMAGNDYNVELDFDNIVGGSLTTIASGPLLGAKYAGVYNTTTSFTIQAIPEPSTYAAILGVVACLGVAFKRRRALAV